MKYRIEPFQPYDVELMKAQGVQPGQLRQVSHIPANYASVARVPGPALTAFVGDRVLICGGILPDGPHHGVLWALVSEIAGAHMLWLHRGVERFILQRPPRRLEATVEDGFPAGCRWLSMLGFRYEGRMRGYGPAGETHLRFARLFEAR